MWKGFSEMRLDAAVAKLLRFKGYGNPAGPFWFIGIEEYGAATEQELLTKASLFRELDDLYRVHSLPEFYFDIRTLIPTWGTMSKIVLRLSGDLNWSDRETRRRYQSQQLGRTNGETFLTELLPLSKKSDSDWPDWWPWPSWDEYAEKVLPGRIQMIRTLFEAHRPRLIFCYGKGYWQFHQRIFPDANFTPILAGKMQIAELGSSTIVLTPFFAWFLMTNKLIDKMAKEIERSH